MTYLRPLLSLKVVACITGLEEKDMLAKIEEGVWAWAFDIKSPASARRCIRVLAACLKLPDGGASLTFDQVFKLIFPVHDGAISAKLLAAAFLVGTTHIHHLTESRLLSPMTERKRGPGGSPMVDIKSVARFLEKRQVL